MKGFWTKGVKAHRTSFGWLQQLKVVTDFQCPVLVRLFEQRHTPTECAVRWNGENMGLGVGVWASHLTSATLTGSSPALIASAALKAGLVISIAYGAD